MTVAATIATAPLIAVVLRQRRSSALPANVLAAPGGRADHVARDGRAPRSARCAPRPAAPAHRARGLRRSPSSACGRRTRPRGWPHAAVDVAPGLPSRSALAVAARRGDRLVAAAGARRRWLSAGSPSPCSRSSLGRRARHRAGPRAATGRRCASRSSTSDRATRRCCRHGRTSRARRQRSARRADRRRAAAAGRRAARRLVADARPGRPRRRRGGGAARDAGRAARRRPRRRDASAAARGWRPRARAAAASGRDAGGRADAARSGGIALSRALAAARGRRGAAGADPNDRAIVMLVRAAACASC